MRTLPIFVLLALACCGAAASPLRQLYDLDDLPLIRTGTRTFQVSSQDPTGGNADANHFVRISGKTAVLADLAGPGVVRRIWSANPSGRLKITIDGAARPALDVPFQDLFQDRVPGFLPPITGESSGGSYCYLPIAFQKSCLITVTDGGPLYYQVTWQKLPPAATIAPFTGRFDESEKTDYAAALNAWNNLGANPGSSRGRPLPRRNISLPPNGRWAQPIQGPGTITELRFELPSAATFAEMRQVLLKITFDGSTCVQTPLADFFGVGFNGVQWKSLALGAAEDGLYCYFRMPFRRSARIELENQGRETFLASFTGMARAGVPSEPWGYFHADYRTAVNNVGQDYVVGRLRGKGHVVGVTESMRGNGSLSFLEGDEAIVVDGETTPGIHGTGTEDFYNCGWYFRSGTIDTALHGCNHKTSNEIGAYRLLIPDAIPFAKSLDFRMEHGGVDDEPGSEYASVLYWYGASGASALSTGLPKGSALLPKPLVRPVEGAVQALGAAWTVKGGTLRRQSWQQISNYRGGGRALLKGKPGALMLLPLDVRFADRYDVQVYLSGAGTASTASLLLDGAAVGAPVSDGPGPLPLRRVTFGPFTLAKGRHTVGLALKSGTSIAVSAIRLVPRSPLVRDYAVLGPFPIRKGQDVRVPLAPDGQAPDLRASYRTAGGTTRWTLLHAPNGILDLAATLTPNTDSVAYAAFAVRSPSARTLPIAIGSDDGVEAYLNGKPFHRHIEARALTVDEDSEMISLKPGWNLIVLKVAQSEDAWAVCARIPDPEGTLEFAAVPAPPKP